uniref:Integration host factor subunit beta n=1 Tax=Candidatus Kentrum sp. DK TaxID=2126562 RepID=A0A450SFT1_9GAMM|nr:MAG: integration host factor subunit beta [Candidatus Kentron sp. DK]VFJ63419.1 MAG: integration host factor subunit beta [Candidatus Kentron sp. DK]
MNKPDLIRHMGVSLKETTQEDLKQIMEIILTSMADAMANGEHIEIRDFGSFNVRYREPRIARNPRTGERVDMPGHYVPRFKAGGELRRRVDAGRKSV